MNNHRHFIFHKPYGTISQFVNPHKREKKLLGDFFNYPKKTMAIGRLDVNSEGLLLLTTNGKISEKIRSSNVEKEYYVQVDGCITQEKINILKSGVIIGFKGKKYTTKPCLSSLIPVPDFKERTQKIRDERHGPTSWISITLKEGKFRQVRKMTAAVGYPTLRLVRIRIGSIVLGNLELGEVKEVKSFFNF
jgi:23S rRNA pseudouridine2457 synthase